MTSTGKGRRGALIPAAAAAALGIAGALMLLMPGTGAKSQPRSAEASPTLAQPAPATSNSAKADSSEVPSSAAPSAGTSAAAGENPPSYAPGQEPWRPVVTGFATDFTHPDPSWSTRVVRWTSDYLTAEYSQLTPDRVPSAALQSLEVVSAGEAVVDVVAVYNTGLRMIIRAEDSVAGWKVTRVEQAD